MKLTIELVPQTAWFKNVRSEVSRAEWDDIRTVCYSKAGFVCEICGGQGDEHPVECHEIWHYDEENNKQTLTGFIALCPKCHKVKHAGFAQMNDEFHIVIEQLMKVNGMTEEEANDYVYESLELWQRRSQYDWECDIKYLENFL